MKANSNTYQKRLLSQIGAVLLLAIFLNALFIQSLHHHEQEDTVSCKHNVEQQFIKQFSKATPKCDLCEVLKQQSHIFDLSAPLALHLAIATPKVNSFVYILKHPIAYILSCANKGPPSLTA